MKVRIINTKENPVIIKSDKKPTFIDKPSWAKSSYLLCPYYQGYKSEQQLADCMMKILNGDIYEFERINYFEGEIVPPIIRMVRGTKIFSYDNKIGAPYFYASALDDTMIITLNNIRDYTNFIWSIRGGVYWTGKAKSDFLLLKDRIYFQPLDDNNTLIRTSAHIFHGIENRGKVTVSVVKKDNTCTVYLDNTIVHITSVDDLDKISLYINNYQYFYMGSMSLFEKDSKIIESDIQDVLNIMEVSCTV